MHWQNGMHALYCEQHWLLCPGWQSQLASPGAPPPPPFYSHRRHPDRHQGTSKVNAEAKFGSQQAYQLLRQPSTERAARANQTIAAEEAGLAAIARRATASRAAAAVVEQEGTLR